MDFESFYVLKNGKYIYQLKDAYLVNGKDEVAKTELKRIIKDNTKKLLENKTFGTGGKYVVSKGGDTKSTPENSEISIVTNITYENFVHIFKSENIDIGKTWRVTQKTGFGPSPAQEEKYKTDLDKIKLKQNTFDYKSN